MARSFVGESVLADDLLSLALAPALTPTGLATSPSFFHGFATHPQVLARGLVTLADITATRYFQYKPVALRDPVLTAHGDRLRAECFSACNSVYARLDLFASGFDGGDISYGTTNVDIGLSTRAALSHVKRDQLLHLDVGQLGLTVSSLDETSFQRRVEMPDRWIRALGNAAEIHRGLLPKLSLNAGQARAFTASLPAATGKTQAGWVTATRTGVSLAPRASNAAVYLNGTHRLSALKRMLASIESMTFYGQTGGEAGPALIEVGLPSARLTLGLTAEAWRGYSGEGALLTSLATPTVLADADLVSALLAFEPMIDIARLAQDAVISQARVQAALAVLASAGRVGWDAHDAAYFHRELPDDPDRVLKDNPRLKAAQRLVAMVEAVTANEWTVRSTDTKYLVHFNPTKDINQARCTCTWYLNHQGLRGPCKHVLAVQLKERQ
jgi:hypothetical protein